MGSRLCCLEIAKQSSEGLLILVVLLPASEITDVALMVDLRCPIERTFKHTLSMRIGKRIVRFSFCSFVKAVFTSHSTHPIHRESIRPLEMCMKYVYNM